MLGPFATASRCTLPLPGVATVARRLRIDVHDDDDDDDNAWQTGPLYYTLYWPWAHNTGVTGRLSTLHTRAVLTARIHGSQKRSREESPLVYRPSAYGPKGQGPLLLTFYAQLET